MMSLLPKLFLFSALVVVISARHRGVFTLDENWICNVKNTCFECLLLPHCSWCETENRCFSEKINGSEVCSSNNTINHINYGFSFEENAECSCSKGDIVPNCFPPDVTEGPACSGRGECVCGQCVCDPTPDPDNPTKTVMGEHCEFDNFSCDGPKCNEGPYLLSSLNQPPIVDEDIENTDD